jgi:hypothetical protein
MSNFLIDEDTDLLAAEFVLGTLDSEERANAQTLLRTDHGFIAMVRIWERRFGELHLMVEPVEPDAKILQRIKAKIAELPPREPTANAKLLAGATASPPSEPTVTPANGELPQPPADGTAPPALPQPQDAASPGTPPPPAEVAVAVAAEAEKPPGTAPAGEEIADALTSAGAEPSAAAEQPVVAPVVEVAEVQPESEPRPQEPVAKSDREPALKPTVAPRTVLPKPSDKPLAIRHPEIIGDVIRSRGRWRAATAVMTLLVVGLVTLLAAWKFVPDRLPAELRPAPVLMSLGIQALPTPAPGVKRPPAAAFDE